MLHLAATALRPRLPRRARHPLAVAAALAAALTLGCSLDTTLRTLAPNDPEVVMEEGDFSFAVRAEGWTTERSYALATVERYLDVSLARENYRGGTGTVELVDYRGEVLYTQPLDGTALQGTRRRVGSLGPYWLRVSTTGFTGTLIVTVIPVRF